VALGLWAYVAKRILFMIPVLLGTCLAVFLLLQLAPGDPVLLLAGERATPERMERIRHEWGLDRPAYIQFFYFMSRIVSGDLGMSIVRRMPVAQLLRDALPVTIELNVVALAVSLAIGIPAGVISAVRYGSLVDQTALVAALIGVSVPSFWLGIILMLVFSVQLRVLPTSGYGTFAHVVLPAIALGTAGAALLSRITRSGVLEVLVTDYIRTARAKGLAERVVIYKHVLKNAMLPVVTVLGLNLGWLLAGSVVLETVFARPGMGRLLVTGILSRDYPVVQGMLLILAVCVMLANLLADLFYAVLDPRIRFD